MTEGGYQPLAFFSFFPVGIIVIAIGIIVLGVKRGDEYITDNLIATKLHVGDMLLVQGEWTNLAHLATDTSNWLYVYGLREGRFAVADYHRRCDDLRSSAPVSLLRIFDIKIKAPDARFLASGALFLLW